MGQQEQRLAELLRTLRLREKMSQGDLGCRIGLHRNVVCRMERDPSQMRLTTLKKWCEVLNEPYIRVLRFAEHAPKSVHDETL